MTSNPSFSRTSAWAGAAVGVLVLALVAAFAIALPRLLDEPDGDVGGTDGAALVLPDTLPGGYAAADDPASFQEGDYADEADSISEQERANSAYGNEVLPDVLGHAAATRTYVLDGSKAVFVQVFAAEGGAFAPNSIPDPDRAGGAPATELRKVGDGVCILTYGQAAPDGSPASPVFSQCQVGRDGLTAQIGAADVPPDDLVATAGALLDELGDE